MSPQNHEEYTLTPTSGTVDPASPSQPQQANTEYLAESPSLEKQNLTEALNGNQQQLEPMFPTNSVEPGAFNSAVVVSTPAYNHPPKLRKTRSIVLTLVGVLLLVAGTAVVVWLLKDAEYHEQQSTAATAQAKAVAQAVSSVQAQVTATVQAQNAATATVSSMATATAQVPVTAEAQQRQATVGPLEQKANRLFSGTGQLNIKNTTSIAVKYASVDVRDAIIKAKFYNPQNDNNHTWDYGFGFRYTGKNQDYRLYVQYNGYWELELVTGTKTGTTNTPVEIRVQDGYVKDLNTQPDAANALALYVKGEKAVFYVNDKYVATFDLLGRMTKGDVYIGTGFTTKNEITGSSLQYEDFSVDSLDDKTTSV